MVSTTMSPLERLGTLFYVVSPNASTFATVDKVPDYTNDAVPMMVLLLLLEWAFSWYRGKNNVRLNDVLTSTGHGFVYILMGLFVPGVTLAGYQWLYERRLLDLDWSSPVTWVVAALGVDLGYYWFHRFTHEVNLVWATHQVHHSSEDYNLSTALRQSVFQRHFSLGFYQPLALLGVPLPALLVHLQFNLIFQFWIHTDAIGSCGPLEWVLNTPSHHRVHHGANKWCLDKNYAGALIVWDRLFGTFQAERHDQPIVYGLVHQPQTLNVAWLQVFYIREVFRKARRMKTWGDCLRALFYGPGWFPGTPRLGDHATLPEMKVPRRKYNPQLPLWHQVYGLLHFLILNSIQYIWMQQLASFSWASALAVIVFSVVTVGLVGASYDGWWWAPLLEAARCLVFLYYARSAPVTGLPYFDGAVVAYFAVSAFIWTCQSTAIVQNALKSSKLD